MLRLTISMMAVIFLLCMFSQSVLGQDNNDTTPNSNIVQNSALLETAGIEIKVSISYLEREGVLCN